MQRLISRIVSNRLGMVDAEAKTAWRVPLRGSLPEERAVLRHDSAVGDQQAPPRNHAAIIKVIVTYHLEFGLVRAAHISIRDFLCLGVFVQFLLAIFQTHSDVRGAFDPPKKIEVITETLVLIERGDCAVKAVLPLKNNGRVLKRRSFLAWRV